MTKIRLTRPILKCWVWFMLINAILNLVLGIVVFSYATEDKSTTWNTLNLVTKRYFNNDSDSYKVAFCKASPSTEST